MTPEELQQQQQYQQQQQRRINSRSSHHEAIATAATPPKAVDDRGVESSFSFDELPAEYQDNGNCEDGHFETAEVVDFLLYFCFHKNFEQFDLHAVLGEPSYEVSLLVAPVKRPTFDGTALSSPHHCGGESGWVVSALADMAHV
eukprot:CAMPEP_0206506260 /NCGR_PEP_ID=MMETSP0324_2-20121206/56654_1 /ASSEMBLY_ACC=CAM_ASM_000836 /TAXON_ID=2866 /ORGANISM="Crypthecodinium cohnii, Strain Seligo" /LENGTH=143 /DNA_ID=CAMNT_0053995945 /DNA_START=218 /DNA_END=650 /DNA_ORIENTATION=+